MGIVWSCLATVIACVWVSVHPNVPGPNEGRFAIAFRRLKIGVLALVTPELVTSWAIRQRLVAGNLAKKYNSEPNTGPEWTLTHGFFTSMGGFMLCKDSQPYRPLNADEIHHLVDNGIITLPSITKKEIMDKSKGDSLSKLLVIVQLGWFMLHCATRAVQRLVITELELVTLAFSVLSIVTYVMWWHKPLLVECSIPIPVPQDCEEPKQRRFKEKEKDLHGFRRSFELLLKALNPVESSIVAVSQQRKPPEKTDGVWAKIKYLASVTGKHAFLPIGWQIVNCLRMGWSERSTALAQDDLRVSTFYAGRMEYAEGPRCGFAVATISVVFGAIHCVAWSFVFASQAEQILWRTSSVILMAVPILFLLVFRFLSFCFSSGPMLPAWSKKLLERVFRLYFILSLVLYDFARISLLLQPFLSLRSLPPGAYQDVNWTSLIPHL